MASIRRRNGLWQVQVRSRHAGSTSKSFHRKTDAERWAIAQEALMQSGQWQEKTPSQYTIGNMLSRYLDIVTPTKRGREQEERRLQRLLRDKQLMSISLDQAQPCIFADFRDRRVKDGVRACQYDLVLMRHAWNTARIEWGWPLPDNPISLIRMPKNNPPRERRLKDGEFERLKFAAEQSRSWYLWPVVVLAVETAMRRGETEANKTQTYPFDTDKVGKIKFFWRLQQIDYKTGLRITRLMFFATSSLKLIADILLYDQDFHQTLYVSEL